MHKTTFDKKASYTANIYEHFCLKITKIMQSIFENGSDVHQLGWRFSTINLKVWTTLLDHSIKYLRCYCMNFIQSLSVEDRSNMWQQLSCCVWEHSTNIVKQILCDVFCSGEQRPTPIMASLIAQPFNLMKILTPESGTSGQGGHAQSLPFPHALGD